MKKIIFIFAVLAVLSFTHYAFARNDGGLNGAGCVNNCGQQQTPPTAPPAGGDANATAHGGLGVGVGVGVGISKSVSAATSSSTSRSSASATGGAGGSASQTMNYTEAQQDYSKTYKKYTPTAVAPSINATTPCLIPISGALGVPGLSVGGGSGVLDKGCEERELIRLGLSSDNNDTWLLANRLLQTRLTAVAESDQEAATKKEPETFSWGNDYE
jgi:hypothetical protein